MAEEGAGGDRLQESESEGATVGENQEESSNGSRGGTTTEQILKLGKVLLQGFIADQVEKTLNRLSDAVLELLWAPQFAPDGPTKKLLECLRKIADDLDGNMELQSLIEQVQSNSPKDVFFKVAAAMFSDGKFNWCRVVTLFYFASKLVIKALLTKVPDLIRTIFDWTMEYLCIHVVPWIRDQGGWEGLLSYVGTPTWQAVSVFLAGALTAAITIWKLQ